MAGNEGKAEAGKLMDAALIKEAVINSFKKLNPMNLIRNPVMFVVEIGAVITTYFFIRYAINGVEGGQGSVAFAALISLWLWFTVLFANFAEAVAEGRGRAQAETLRRTRVETTAKLLQDNGEIKMVSAGELRKGQVVVAEAGDVIPGDGEVIEGIASVDESAITGESAPVIRAAGGDFSSVTGGTMVLSDQIKIKISANPGESFLDKMISLVEGAQRQKTPNEIALSILLVAFTIIFLVVVFILSPLGGYLEARPDVTSLVALLVCLIPTTIGGLLSAIGIAGINRLTQYNVLAMSGRAVEAAGDINTLLLDKTGTITFGNRFANEFSPFEGHNEDEVGEVAMLSSFGDGTPEGQSILTLGKKLGIEVTKPENCVVVEFTAETRMSGLDCADNSYRKGAADAIAKYAVAAGHVLPSHYEESVQFIASQGSTPLAVARDGDIIGLVELKDVVKPGISERFERLRAMGIKTMMITGDNPFTAKTIAGEAGVDDFVAEAKPEDKMGLIRNEQGQGKLVAMTGDGTNDAPALAIADVGLAMNSGTQAAKEAGNMVDLDSDPAKLIEVVEIGKQLLITRGSLTTFSIANDVSKYFAIIPALFMAYIPGLASLNIMRLYSHHSAILSAVIFNALIIIALVPLALKGVKYRPLGASAILRRNILIYGIGGLIAPFIGIKLIDMLLRLFHF
ncbi:MAG: potassium-transporting ATPase subunit B [Candidatus Solincola sediminis]|nr:MAG: potassium-transporting ATPase subunit B [Candidatus Solincola sediminis]